MEQLPNISFFDSANTDQFFQFVYAILYIVAPLLIIVLATDLGGYLIEVIRSVFTFKRFKKDQDTEYDDD